MMLNEKYKSLLEANGINTIARLSNLFGQLEHESNLKPISENLNYSSEGLLKTFPRYFTSLTAIQYRRQPEKIANRVYANRMGNGDENSGEGWKYRGRGFIQITGKENYFQIANDFDIDCLKNPDLLLEEANAMISAIWFWKKHKLNVLADQNNVIEITRKINGGLNGLADRKSKVEKWKILLTNN